MKTTKFVFWLMPFLVFSLVCSFATTATAQNYFPSMVGNTWVLLSTDGAERRTYAFEGPDTIDGVELILLKLTKETVGTDVVAFDESWITVEEDGEILLHQVAFDRGAFGIAEATFDPPVTNFPAALPLGHTWEIVTETVLKLVGAATTTSTIEVVAIEDVETPIGVFKDCVKIETKRKAVTALTIVRENEFLWLAPDVGPVKYTDVAQDIEYELESYNLVEAPTTEEAPVAEETPVSEEVSAVEETSSTEEAPVEMPVSQMFEVTLMNLTTGEHGVSGQTLSPAIFVTHGAGINLVPVGEAASPALAALAEGGDTSGLAAIAAAAGANVVIAMNADGTRRYTMPGQSTTVTVTADMTNSSLSIGSMLVSTNDAFIAATDVALFDEDGMPVSTSLDLMAYDAGSEENTEMASDIPGPLGLDEATDPPMSNERVPTEGGVIAAHEGIQGVGDVTEAFAWEEPTATLTITPVEAPAEPVVEEPMPEPVVEGPGFDITLEPGLNMISIPLMPAEPYTAKSLAEMLNATAVIQLDATSQRFVGYTVADEGDGFGITGDKGYIVNTPAGAAVKFTGDAWDNQPERPEPEPMPEEPVAEDVPDEEAPAEEAPVEDAVVEDTPAEETPAEEVVEEDADADAEGEDANGDDAAADAGGDAAEEAPAEEAAADAEGDAPAAPVLRKGGVTPPLQSAWAFIVTSDIHGMQTGTAYTLVAENLRTGTIATENVTSTAKRSSAVWADLNRKSVVEAGDKLKVALYDDTNRIVSGPFQRTVTTSDIRNAFLTLQLRVGDVQPQDTLLAQNFPNPFNPETWIPYQLSKATEVQIDIYDISGRLVRSLDLGWQPTGSYMTPSSAAYWDGRNAVGERVASGIYFYTLQTSDFTATRRMVILK